MSVQANDMSAPKVSDRSAKYLQSFERYLHSERQLSDHTVRNYLYELHRTNGLLPDGIDLLNVAREHWQQVLAKLHRKGLSPRSLSLCLSAIKQWGEFLVLTGVPYSRMTVFGSHFFETTNYVGFNQAIDLGYLVMTNLNAGNGDYHNVVVVGYHQNGVIIYMDPIYGSFRESPITDFPKNYVLTIKKCK